MTKTTILSIIAISAALAACSDSNANPRDQGGKQITSSEAKKGPNNKPICLEFTSDEAFSVYATEMRIPHGTKISYKQGDACKGILVDKKDIKF